MANIPQVVLDQCPPLADMTLRGRGKVRDSYDTDIFEEDMLVVASDRCSIFDFVLPVLISLKGQVLTALNYFWVKEVLGDLVLTDLIACGADVDKCLPKHLRGNPELQKRSTQVKMYPSPEDEDIARLILTGSGWTSYQESQQICGHVLPKGLTNGSLLPYPIYTPTTKAVVGHDEHITADSVVKKSPFGFMKERATLQIAGLMASHADRCGLKMADTKFELYVDPVTGRVVLLDEKGTPDSSRFVDAVAWRKALEKGKFPPSLDKQYVREWGKKLGIDVRDPKNPDDIAYVHSLTVPDDVVRMTTLIYRYIFWRLTGHKLEEFQRLSMGIEVHDVKLHTEVVVGSKNDLDQLKGGLSFLTGSPASRSYDVSVISCHRNADKLPDFVRDVLTKADRVVVGAGKAAALPGIVKSLLCMNGHPEIPVIGVAMTGKTSEDDRDATGSIKGLPGQHVELNEAGEAYLGASGFLDACSAALYHEYLPRSVEVVPERIGKAKCFE